MDKLEIEPLTSDVATPDTIASIEAAIGHDIPSDYRSFLLLHNGGQVVDPRTAVFEFMSVISGKIENSLVDKFFPVTGEGMYTIKKVIFDLDEIIPEGFVPFARDPFGNLMLLCANDSGFGNVIFWDHDNQPGVIEDTVYSFVSPTFSEFMASLRTEDI